MTEPVPIYSLPKNAIAGNLDRDSPCIICCGMGNNLDIRHAHLFTQFFNKQSLIAGDSSPYCHHCKREHPIDFTARLRVISTSTLFGVPYVRQWPGCSFHVDWDCMAGGRNDPLRRSWDNLYG